MGPRPNFFKDHSERNQWIIDNAEYYTATRFINRKTERREARSLIDARAMAQEMLAQNPIKPVMIYAVNGTSDALVETVNPETYKGHQRS